MINAVFLIVIFFCLIRWFYHTVIVLAIWWQVLQNLYFPPYSFTGICTAMIGLCLIFKLMKREIVWKNFPLRKAFIFLFLCYGISVVNGVLNLGNILRVLGIFVIPISSFFAIQKIGKFWNFLFLNILIYAIIILSVGFVELYCGFNPIILWLQSVGVGDYSSEQREDYIRFGMYRCQSLLVWCSTYGVTCGLTAVLLLLLNFYKRVKYSLVLIIFAILLLFGMFTSGTRSVYMAICICMLAYVFQAAFKFKYLVAVLLLFIGAYFMYSDFFDQVLFSFIDTSSVGGSDTELRISQFNITMNEFLKNPLIGNGEGRCAALVDRNIGLLGAESFIYWTLIDRGMMGVAGTLFLLYSTLKYVMRYNVLLCFIPLGIMVGKYMSLFPHIDETYYFFYLFILLRAYREYSVSYK